MTIQDIVQKVSTGETCNIQTYNEETGTLEVNKVKAGILTKKAATVVELTVEEDGAEYHVTCTPDHRFYTKNRGWVECKDLTHEDDLVLFPTLK